MRGLLIAGLIFMWIPLVAFKPHVGVLVWSWVSHMVPQSYTYNFARTFPFLDIIALLTVAGLFLSKDKKELFLHPVVVAMFMYLVWILITTVAAFNPAVATDKLIHMTKVMMFAFVSMIVMQSPNRLKAFLYIIGLSMAFIAVKGGIFTLITGGSGRVQGAGGMMEDNNQLAMALAMFLPLAIYFYKHPPMKIMKWPCLGLVVCTALSVLGTQSRGGLVALSAVLGMLLLKSKYKFKILMVLIPVIGIGINYMPETWTNRMSTIETATDDSSFLGRVSMWRFSSNLADDNPIEGGGFNTFYVKRAQELYMPPGFEPRAPHSIYFEVLGEHGYMGLILFMTVLFTGWYAGGTLSRRFSDYEETAWIGDLGSAIQLSVVGFAVGGLTVNIATFDFFYHLLSLLVMGTLVAEKISEEGLTKRRTNISDKVPEKKKVDAPAAGKWSPY